VENTCKRALFFVNPRRVAVKSILLKGLDQLPLEEKIHDWEPLSSTYTCTGRFLRPAAELQ
jgi:hypothetical protein